MLKAAVSLTLVGTASACTIIAVGKVAGGGSTFLAHTDDAGGGTQDVRLVRVPAADWPEGSVRNVYATEYPYPRLVVNERGEGYSPNENETMSKPVGTIPQVPHTYAYWDTDYGVMNEKSLAIAESTCGARTAGWATTASPPGECLWGIDELSRVALERCDTARCAIETMGALAEESGFYSNAVGSRENPLYEDSAECLGISDKDGEVWLFHVMSGVKGNSAVWVAQKLKDTDVTVTANGMSIRDVTVSDTENFLIAKNAVKDAKEMGWWVPGRTHGSDIDFVATYGQVLDYSKGLPLSILYVGRRVWRVLSLFAPSLNLDPTLGSVPTVETYPWSVTPDKGIVVEDIFNTLRDYFQGTEFDLSKGPMSGPFHTPARYDVPMVIRNQIGAGGFERAISTYRTTFSFVAVTRPHLPSAIGGMVWYGQDSPWGTAYVPFYGSQNEVHSSYMKGHMAQYDPESAYWIFNFLNNWAQLRFNVMQPEMLAIAQKFEADAIKEHADIEKAVIAKYEDDSEKDKKKILKELEDWSLNRMHHILKEWKALTTLFLAKYHNGWKTNFEGDNSGKPPPYGPGPAVQCLGYDGEWLKETGFNDWPGKTYTPVDANGKPIKDTTASSVSVHSSTSATTAGTTTTEHPEAVNNFTNIVFSIGLVVALVALGNFAWNKFNSRQEGYTSIGESSNTVSVEIPSTNKGGVPQYAPRAEV